MSAMINWDSVLINASWIVGLAILLAEFSYKRWQKAVGDDNSHPSGYVIKIIAYILIGIGLIGTASTWWERLIWIALIGTLIFLTYKSVTPPNAASEP